MRKPYISSGNIFKDLGVPNPLEELAKVKLASKINSLVAEKRITQKQAADFLGVSRSKMTALRNGRLDKFTIDLLFSLLAKLDDYIEIRVKPKCGDDAQETISVAQI
jgi:predicted XRE-type DNA-binding protein